MLMVKTGFLVLPVLGLRAERKLKKERRICLVVRENTYPGVKLFWIASRASSSVFPGLLLKGVLLGWVP